MCEACSEARPANPKVILMTGNTRRCGPRRGGAKEASIGGRYVLAPKKRAMQAV